MKDKVVSLQEAAGMVRSGHALSMTTSLVEDTPMAFLRELIRSRKRDLKVIGVTGGGLNVDLLIGAGAASAVETCSLSLGPFGPAPNFQRRLKRGEARIIDSTCGVMYSMVQAAAMGVPFVPVRGLLGTDLLEYRDDFKVVEDPFSPTEDIVLAPALKADVAIFHGLRADRAGNVITPPHRDDLLVAQAADKVVVTVEEVVRGTLEAVPPSEGTFIPAIYLDAIVYAPFGTHPAGCWGGCDVDASHLREYVEASSSQAAFSRYLDRYVFGMSGQREYLQAVGLPVRQGSV